MNCAACRGDSKVIDSRLLMDGTVRRRRECLNCRNRWTTHEEIFVEERDVIRDKPLEVILKALRTMDRAARELEKIHAEKAKDNLAGGDVERVAEPADGMGSREAGTPR